VSEQTASSDRAAIFAMVREHLSSELELDPGEITDEAHFRDDLDADSLDLYELVMELEDTYGVAMSEQEASRIETVGQAVDFVFDRAGNA